MLEFIGSLLTFVLTLAVLFGIGIAVILVKPYNHMRRSRELVEKAASDVNNALQHKESLESKMNEIFEQYGMHELLAINQAAGADAEMNPTMGGAYVSYSRDYPQLKADKTYSRLADEHNQWANELLVRRDRYNNCAMQYNNHRASFPAVLIAGRLGFERAPYFDEIAVASDSYRGGVFKTDTGALLRKNLADAGLLVGEKSKQIAAGVSERSVKAVVFGKSKIDIALGRGETQGNAGNRARELPPGDEPRQE